MHSTGTGCWCDWTDDSPCDPELSRCDPELGRCDPASLVGASDLTNSVRLACQCTHWRSAASRASSSLRLTTSLARAARRPQRLVGPPDLARFPRRCPLHETPGRKRHGWDAAGRFLVLECSNDGVQVIAMGTRDRLAVLPHLFDDRIPTHNG